MLETHLIFACSVFRRRSSVVTCEDFTSRGKEDDLQHISDVFGPFVTVFFSWFRG